MLLIILDDNMKLIVLLLCLLSLEALDKTALPRCGDLSRRKNIRIIYSIAIFTVIIAINANYFWMLGYWIIALVSIPKDIVIRMGKTKYYTLLTLCAIGVLWLSCTPYALKTPF